MHWPPPSDVSGPTQGRLAPLLSRPSRWTKSSWSHSSPETRPIELSHLNIFAQHTRTRLAAEDVAELVDGDEFGTASGLRVRIAALIENEVVHEPGPRIADPDALFPARIVHAVRF